VRARIEEVGIVPAVRVADRERARFAAESVFSGGIPIVEITMTVPHALDVIAGLRAAFPEMAVGAGTVLDAVTAHRCLDAGALFLTSPGFVPDVVRVAVDNDTVVFPGALSPSEVISAWKAGADFVKVFPCEPMGGHHYIRALKAPFPQVPMIASGGVTQHTAEDFMAAGASALGIGADLMPPEALSKRNDAQIHELARRFLTMVKDGRAKVNHFV
jgi:2-dehydro-3-deoxyphosphogluconate aldolase/(4S)-4-hydroxy-2-oxoglutarate aldolase